MSRIVNRPVAVHTDKVGHPVAFYWHGRWWPITVLERWQDTGSWWQGEREKAFFRVGSKEGLFELYHEEGTHWVLYRVYD